MRIVQKLRENNAVVVSLIFLVAVVIVLIGFKMQAKKRYVNKEYGYEATSLADWKMEVTRDRKSVILKRQNGKTYGDSLITFTAEMGNPYGSHALDYLTEGILPRLRYEYEAKNHAAINFKQSPAVITRGGREWAAVSFLVNYSDLQMIHVAMENGFVYAIGLYSTGTDQDNDEKAFYKFLDAVVIRKKTDDNIFSQK